jgi:hypothetical protein
MFDLFYIFSEWLTNFITQFPMPTKTVIEIIEEVPTEVVVNDYLLALTNNTNIIIYLLWSILLLLTIWFVLGFVKAIYYYIMEIVR